MEFIEPSIQSSGDYEGFKSDIKDLTKQMDWLEPLRLDTERIRLQNIKIREETERLREANLKLREGNLKLKSINTKKLIQQIMEKMKVGEPD